MTNLYLFLAAAVAAAQAAGQPAPPSAPVPGQITEKQAENILAQCGSRRFQTSVEFEVDGKMRRTGMRVCATPDDSDAAWIQKLQKAADSVEAQQALPDSAKTKLLADLRAEIARVKAQQHPSLPAQDALVATVPPMPPPLPPQAEAPVGYAAVSQLLSGPRLSIRCLDDGDLIHAEQCDEFSRTTVLSVKADSTMTGPARLRFVRKGKLRKEVPLAKMASGQTFRIPLPREVCAGVVRSEVTIEVLPGADLPGRVVPATDTKGPFTIRC